MQGFQGRPQTFTLMLALLSQVGQSIKITSIKVPPLLYAGSDAELSCNWSEEGDRMYSVKWYQGGNEFYRFTPSAHNKVQIFHNPTLDVEPESFSGTVRITNVSVAAEGLFHCEVSAEGPTFYTASDTRTITVVDIPDGDPIVEGVQSRYKLGDPVDLSCISRRSKPPAKLRFSINNKPVSSAWLDPLPRTNDSEGLTTSYLRLRFILRPDILRHGEAQVACGGYIPELYDRKVVKVLSINAPRQSKVTDLADKVVALPCTVVLAVLVGLSWVLHLHL